MIDNNKRIAKAKTDLAQTIERTEDKKLNELLSEALDLIRTMSAEIDDLKHETEDLEEKLDFKDREINHLAAQCGQLEAHAESIIEIAPFAAEALAHFDGLGPRPDTRSQPLRDGLRSMGHMVKV